MGGVQLDSDGVTYAAVHPPLNAACKKEIGRIGKFRCISSQEDVMGSSVKQQLSRLLLDCTMVSDAFVDDFHAFCRSKC
jgi:hypothetical protein